MLRYGIRCNVSVILFEVVIPNIFFTIFVYLTANFFLFFYWFLVMTRNMCSCTYFKYLMNIH